MSKTQRRLKPNPDSSDNLHAQYGLTPRWFPMARHDTQRAFLRSPHRFISMPAGRRSGKTELVKRRGVVLALLGTPYPNSRYFFAAPTNDQAIRIWWQDLVGLIPNSLIRAISLSRRCITLTNGSELWVVGLDKPERIEGTPWDGCNITEFANVRAEAWEEHILPALMDRRGYAVLEGVPEGRNHFYEIDRVAQAEMKKHGNDSEWGRYHWRSEEILPLYGRADEVERRKRTMDSLTYEQELGASFVNFQGRAYYAFNERLHVGRFPYDPSKPLIFCFDFNVDPGVAVICQERDLPAPASQLGTACIDEVYITRNSNTPRVCQELISRYRTHEAGVSCYGDPAGGARHTSQTSGTDWEIIRTHMRQHFGKAVFFKVPRAAPAVRERLNAVNSRLMAISGGIRMMIDGSRCQHLQQDLEGVTRSPDGNIDKQKHKDDGLTHLSDALGYYIAERFPVRDFDAKSGPLEAILTTRD